MDMKGLKKGKIIILLTAMTLITIVAAFFMFHRWSEADLPVSVTAKKTGGIAGTYNEYRVYRENERYYIDNTTHWNCEPSEKYEITKEEYMRSVNKALLDTESFEIIVKGIESRVSDGFRSRSVISYEDGTEKEICDAPFYYEFETLMDSKRLEAGKDENIEKENNRIAVAFTDVCYKYRVKDADLTIIGKKEEGGWELSPNGAKEILYRGDDTDITLLEAARHYLKNEELQNLLHIIYATGQLNHDILKGSYPGSWSKGDDTVAVYLDEASGLGIVVYIRDADLAVRPMLLHEMKSILMDKDKRGGSELSYMMLRILQLLILEVLVVIAAIIFYKAAKRLKLYFIPAAAMIFLIILILIIPDTTGNITFNEATGELTLSGSLSREDILKYSDNGNVTSIVAKKGTKLPKDCRKLFSDRYWRYLLNIDITEADTSAVTDMSYMFYGCDFIRELDVSGFDTSRVTNMESMFANCTEVEKLDTSGFDTSNVTNMSEMFVECRYLETLDLSGFDTSNVTDMHGMFSACMNLQDPDFSSFDTSNVTDMGAMFDRCYAIRTLDLSSFDTSKVTTSEFMIFTLRDIETIYISEDKWTLTDKDNFIEDIYKKYIEYK